MVREVRPALTIPNALFVHRPTAIKLVLSLAMLGVAGFFFFRFWRDNDGISEKSFFYDISESKLFTASRTAVPPIKGLHGTELDAVRAVVISTTGNCDDKSSRKVAYLEMYSPELKSQMEAAQATGGSPQMGRSAGQAHRFVRRVDDKQWYPMNSTEGGQIVNEWATPGPNGITPVVCAP